MTDPSPTPLTREQVEKLAGNLATDGRTGGYVNEWMGHDSRQRQELEALKRENERLNKMEYSISEHPSASGVATLVENRINDLTHQLASREARVKELEEALKQIIDMLEGPRGSEDFARGQVIALSEQALAKGDGQ